MCICETIAVDMAASLVHIQQGSLQCTAALICEHCKTGCNTEALALSVSRLGMGHVSLAWLIHHSMLSMHLCWACSLLRQQCERSQQPRYSYKQNNTGTNAPATRCSRLRAEASYYSTPCGRSLTGSKLLTRCCCIRCSTPLLLLQPLAV